MVPAYASLVPSTKPFDMQALWCQQYRALPGQQHTQCQYRTLLSACADHTLGSTAYRPTKKKGEKAAVTNCTGQAHGKVRGTSIEEFEESVEFETIWISWSVAPPSSTPPSLRGSTTTPGPVPNIPSSTTTSVLGSTITSVPDIPSSTTTSVPGSTTTSVPDTRRAIRDWECTGAPY
eukprot:3941509-Rhodomonas_salina.2